MTLDEEMELRLDEVKAYLRLDDVAGQEGVLTILLEAARMALEAETRRVFMSQGLRYIESDLAAKRIVVPVAPVSAVTEVGFLMPGGSIAPFAPEAWRVMLKAGDPVIELDAARTPVVPETNPVGIAVRFTAGYGAAADVPAPLRQGILQLIAHWFEHREAVTCDGPSAPLPASLDKLVAPYRRWRL